MLLTDQPKYPEINIQLVGQDGNAYSILGRCTDALKRNGLRDQVEAFRKEATSGDYDNVLRTVMAWFSVDTEEHNEDECTMCYESHEDCECED
jgi:hypothetical protein